MFKHDTIDRHIFEAQRLRLLETRIVLSELLMFLKPTVEEMKLNKDYEENVFVINLIKKIDEAETLIDKYRGSERFSYWDKI